MMSARCHRSRGVPARCRPFLATGIGLQKDSRVVLLARTYHQLPSSRRASLSSHVLYFLTASPTECLASPTSFVPRSASLLGGAPRRPCLRPPPFLVVRPSHRRAPPPSVSTRSPPPPPPPNDAHPRARVAAPVGPGRHRPGHEPLGRVGRLGDAVRPLLQRPPPDIPDGGGRAALCRPRAGGARQ